MSGLFGVLGVAGRSMLIVQDGIRTTGHNIANADTPGYSRQVQRLQSVPGLTSSDGTLGAGVEQATIERVTDAFLQRELLAEESAGGAIRAQRKALSAIEEVLNEQPGGGISAALSELYAAFDDLASSVNPGGGIEREAVIGAARGLVDSIRRADAALRDRQRAAEGEIRTIVPQINGLLERIAELNADIVQRESLAPANDLRDQRDQLLRELAGKLEVQTFEEENGAVVVMLSAGPTLVERDRARTLGTAPDLTNPFDASFSRILFDDGSPGGADVTAEIGGGELGGLLRVRDTIAPAAIRSLDVVAYNLAESTNAVHAAGFGLDGSTGNDFFAPLAAVEDAARDLDLSAAILASRDAIAAGALGADPADNGNALELAALRDQGVTLALPGDPPGPPSGPTRTLLDHVAIVAADVGLQARSASDGEAQHARVLQVIDDRRDEVSGVSIDEEVTNLVRLQASFQANARVVSVVDRLLQDVLGMI